MKANASITFVIKDLMDGLTSLVFPPHCPLCQNYHRSISPDGKLCLHCHLRIKKNHPPFCVKCSRHLVEPIQSKLCKNCIQHRFHFDFLWSSTLLNPSLRRLIHLFKYHHQTALRHYFNKLMCSFIDAYHLDVYQFDYIIPIPLFPSKLRERGYNQSELLAKELAKSYALNLETQVLRKVRPTKNQIDCLRKERFTNIQGAFKIRPSYRVLNKHVLIIDDLITTGATVSEAAKTLKSAGAQTVGVMTLGMTP